MNKKKLLIFFMHFYMPHIKYWKTGLTETGLTEIAQNHCTLHQTVAVYLMVDPIEIFEQVQYHSKVFGAVECPIN